MFEKKKEPNIIKSLGTNIFEEMEQALDAQSYWTA